MKQTNKYCPQMQGKQTLKLSLLKNQKKKAALVVAWLISESESELCSLIFADDDHLSKLDNLAAVLLIFPIP